MAESIAGPGRAAAEGRRALRSTAEAFEALHNYLVACDWRGYEFDDILGSAFVRRLTGGNRLLERVAIQAGRRSVINFRPLVGVKKLESSKASGFFAKGYLWYHLATGDQTYLELAKKHLASLLRKSCPDYSGLSWGNAFDFVSRGGFIPKGLPTIVWTAHIADSFDLAYERTKIPEYRDAVRKIGLFVMENIGRLEDDTGACLGYVPGTGRVGPIHNSSLLGAVALLRAWRLGADRSYRDLAQRVVAWSCSRINPDGSWYYGDLPMFRWIDNFHTGYNLDSLVAAQDIGGPSMVAQDIIDRTYRFWVDHFFMDDGRPKYYHDSLYPIDIQCAAQAIESLAKYAEREPAALDLSAKVAGWTVAAMQKRNGAFAFRRGRVVRNGLESIHWGESTMLSALGCLQWRLGSRRT